MIQLTDHPSINHATYFLESSFTPDGSRVLFTSYRAGQPQLFAVPYPGGDAEQLTQSSPIHPYSPAIRDDRVFFVRGGEIWQLNLNSREERRIVSFDGQLGEACPDSNGDWLVAAIKRGGSNGLVCGRSDGSSWTFIPFPRTVIHPQFHPLEPEWIEFAGDPAPRMHRVRRDGSGLECLYEHGNDEFVVHETFLGNTGDLVFTVWPRALCRFDWTTRRISTIAGFNAWHITPNRAGTQVLCDTNHPDTGIWLIDAKTGERRFVCRSESSNRGSQWLKSTYALNEDFVAAQRDNLSWMETPADTIYGPQWTHPHPAFSCNERIVTFTSDRTGYPQVYAVELLS
ncbi:MAG: PD40 domain-containing protein [Acidobacteriota bacterium]|nr:PD40 domain-containing protein [Acidobacteriota bacterium]